MVDEIGLAIGRFHPLHKGHIEHIKQIIADGRKPYVLIPTHQAIPREPFSFKDRKKMIEIAFKDSDIKPTILPISATYDYLGKEDGNHHFDITKWKENVAEVISAKEPDAQKYIYIGVTCETHLFRINNHDFHVRVHDTLLHPYSDLCADSVITAYRSPVCSTDIRKTMITKEGKLTAQANTFMNQEIVKYLNENCDATLKEIYGYYDKKRHTSPDHPLPNQSNGRGYQR